MSEIKGKVIFCTGGTGSFGNAVVKKLLTLNPKRIIIFSRDELKQELMRNEYNDPRLRFIIGDIRDKNAIDRAIHINQPDYLFHAAALKQVPAAELFPMEYIKTNVLGSENVFSSAVKHGVKRVVILSTDKAVYPINVMGMTKALMEKLMINYSKQPSPTIFCGVRYGNVLYSRGSVVPYFISLIKQGKRLRVTNPYMTRFLLTLDDAVDLVLETLVNGENGKMYIKRASACDIASLALAINKIFNIDDTYETIGIKTGEKIHETLEINLLEDDFTSENTKRLTIEEIKELLLSLPEIQKEIAQQSRK